MHVTCVETVHECHQIRKRRRCRQALKINAQPGLRSGLHFVADVNLGGRILTDEHDAEARWPAGTPGELGNARLHRCPDLSSDKGPVEDSCRHGQLPGNNSGQR